MFQIAWMFPMIHAARRFTSDPVERRTPGDAQDAHGQNHEYKFHNRECCQPAQPFLTSNEPATGNLSRPTPVGWPLVARGRGGATSVSYTHLTLPTIYSV